MLLRIIMLVECFLLIFCFHRNIEPSIRVLQYSQILIYMYYMGMCAIWREVIVYLQTIAHPRIYNDLLFRVHTVYSFSKVSLSRPLDIKTARP